MAGARRKRRPRPAGRRSPGSGRGHSKASAPISSSFPRLIPSRAAIRLGDPHAEPAVCRHFLSALAGVGVLIYLGGRNPIITAGIAVALAGAFVLWKPPLRSLGRWVDLSLVGLVGVALAAFIPVFYWKVPAWREAAVDAGVALPGILSIQPWLSVEVLLALIAGLAWFYSAAGWPLNHSGRKWVFFWMSCLICLFAGWSIVENIDAWNAPGGRGEEAPAIVDLLAVGGVVAYAFAMEGLPGRKLLHLAGLLGAVLCGWALLTGGTSGGLYVYFAGILAWSLFRLRWALLPRRRRLLLQVLVLVMGVALAKIGGLLNRDFIVDAGHRSAAAMWMDAPVTGVGLGNYETLRPQYINESTAIEKGRSTGGAFSRFAAETGLLGVICLGVLIGAYLRRVFPDGMERSAIYRVIALAGVFVFLLQCLVTFPSQRAGTVFFALLLAAVAVPKRKGGAATLPQMFWRGLGSALLLVGGIWMMSGYLKWPGHSAVHRELHQKTVRDALAVGNDNSARKALDALVAANPLEGRFAFQRAELALRQAQDFEAADQDFRRARAATPYSGDFAFREGELWLEYDTDRAITAWGIALEREPVENGGRSELFLRMLHEAEAHPELMPGLIALSRLDSESRPLLLSFLRGRELMAQIQEDRRSDPGLNAYTPEQRFAIVKQWVLFGDLETAERFLTAYQESLKDSWLLWAFLRKSQARFEEAATLLRRRMPQARIPGTRANPQTVAHMKRSFLLGGDDVPKGAGLLRYYLDAGEAGEAMEIVDALLKIPNPPAYAIYWRGELLYRAEDYVESWYAFEEYVKRLE